MNKLKLSLTKANKISINIVSYSYYSLCFTLRLATKMADHFQFRLVGAMYYQYELPYKKKIKRELNVKTCCVNVA